ncbi:hypothetical protein Rhopal_000902-T1 [Rhodotorula paludigena]|uniref:Chitin synthase export chaperone n=1 Tax=Rhodotorula paludigena TaxID=86838 RepID=A0AAV5GF21_9BASI|nr:hypothetical protein Rhopal_000902-T1 [Rhodotorula paludigena]
MADGEPGFFGSSTRSKRLRANTSALLFTVYTVVLTGCAGATSGVFGSLARSSTAEGNDEVIWSSPVSFSTGTAVVHAVLLVASISLTIVLFLYRNTDRKKLAIALLAFGILILIGVVVFGVGWAMIYLNETLVQRIEEAWYVLLAIGLEILQEAYLFCMQCDVRRDLRGHIHATKMMEVAALILAIWLLAAVAIYRKAPPDPKPGSDSHDDEKHLLNGSTSHSLGRRSNKNRHNSRYSKSGGSRRDKYDDAYSMSKKSSRRSRADYHAEYDDRA